jgi:hypothetical protein
MQAFFSIPRKRDFLDYRRIGLLLLAPNFIVESVIITENIIVIKKTFNFSI